MHDFAYYLGFTEQNWNAQDFNFGQSEKWQQNDAVVGDSQSGAQTTMRNNANMITFPDGQSSITNMYFFQPVAASFYAPCVDGDYDMSIIGHEYTHMIENRMIGKGSTRSGFQAGAMGESVGRPGGGRVPGRERLPAASDDARRYAVGRVRHRQQGDGDPGLPARRRHGRRRAGAEQAAVDQRAELQRHRLRRHRLRRSMPTGRSGTRRTSAPARSSSTSTRRTSRSTIRTFRSPARRASCLRRTARATGAGSSSCSTRSC